MSATKLVVWHQAVRAPRATNISKFTPWLSTIKHRVKTDGGSVHAEAASLLLASFDPERASTVVTWLLDTMERAEALDVNIAVGVTFGRVEESGDAIIGAPVFRAEALAIHAEPFSLVLDEGARALVEGEFNFVTGTATEAGVHVVDRGPTRDFARPPELSTTTTTEGSGVTIVELDLDDAMTIPPPAKRSFGDALRAGRFAEAEGLAGVAKGTGKTDADVDQMRALIALARGEIGVAERLLGPTLSARYRAGLELRPRDFIATGAVDLGKGNADSALRNGVRALIAARNTADERAAKVALHFCASCLRASGRPNAAKHLLSA